MAAPPSLNATQMARLGTLLSLTAGKAYVPAAPLQLEPAYEAWAALFPDNEARILAVAMHDIRFHLADHLGIAPEALLPSTRLSPLLPHQARRKAWEAIAQSSKWPLPRMGMPAWLQTLFGAAFISGLVLPFIWPLPGGLVLPITLALSFFLEKRMAYLSYPTLEALAGRALELNLPALELGKFEPEDVERVFFELVMEAERGN